MSLRGWLTDLRLGLATQNAAARAAQGIYMGEGVLLARAIGRYLLYVPARDLSIVPGLITAGRFDPWTGRLIAGLAKPGMVVADVGANLGYFTMLMADRVGAGGQVLAFEPSDELAGLVTRSIAANRFEGRIALHPVALGAEDGREMILVTPGDHLAGTSVWEPDRTHPSARPVTIRRLDRIPGAERIALAKIDAEGFEPAIWEGMAGLLAGDMLRIILMEFTAGHYADPAGFVRAIRAAGFRIDLVDKDRGPVPIRDETLAGFPAHHIVNLLLRR